MDNAMGRQSWELLREDIELMKKLGEGAYGEVYMGKLKLKTGVKVNVAIKMAKLESLTKEKIKEVMAEACLMNSFDHPHIVKFYGVAAGTESLMVLMELVECGALDTYLTKNPNLGPDKKMEMCKQAAWGVEYLHNRSVLHRDIAARNCLYGDNKVKISDFGLTREGTTFEMDPHCRVPIRWLAPETLRTAIYSQKTDVWAFGILCWEIFAAAEPYPGMNVVEVNNNVQAGYRMTFPDGTPSDMITFVNKYCWSENPNDRGSMPEVARHLKSIYGGIQCPFKDISLMTDPFRLTKGDPQLLEPLQINFCLGKKFAKKRGKSDAAPQTESTAESVNTNNAVSQTGEPRGKNDAGCQTDPDVPVSGVPRADKVIEAETVKIYKTYDQSTMLIEPIFFRL